MRDRNAAIASIDHYRCGPVELQRRLPAGEIEVENAGVSGETSIDMVKRFDRDVLSHQPDLVIWQVGTNAVLQDFDIARYRQVAGQLSDYERGQAERALVR